MSKGMFTAVSGAIAQSQRLDTIANNLANVNTPGFKRDGQLFREYLSAYEKEPTNMSLPRIAASVESFYNMQGGDKSFVDANSTFTDFSQGGLRSTGNQLDVAIEGNGFFEIGTPDGVKLTRAGSFTINSEGTLVTKQGYPVLSDSSVGLQDPAARQIKIKDAHVTIGENGQVVSGDQIAGKISVVHVGNRDALLKTGQNLYTFKDNIDAQMSVDPNPKMNQGFLEVSNVNVVREMTDMITATRTFESTQKAIQAYDQMSGKAVNEISKLKEG